MIYFQELRKFFPVRGFVDANSSIVYNNFS